MNSVQLVGRFTRDPDIRYTNGGSSIARFSLAVGRIYKQENGPDADFISCVAFGKTAEFIEKYFHKGQRIGVTGRIQTGSYINKDGQKVYTTDVIVEDQEFADSKNSSSDGSYGGGRSQSQSYQQVTRPAPSSAIGDGFMNIPDGVEDEGLPFN